MFFGMNRVPRIAVEPDSRPAMHAAFAAAVERGGGALASVDVADALIWADPARASDFPEVIARAPGVRWIQLPYAGIEPFRSYLDTSHTWTCGKGVYARPVAEHALTLMLAGLRGLATYGRAKSWQPPIGHNLIGAHVVIFGGGGICEELLRLLTPFDCAVTVVRRHLAPVGRARVVRSHEGRDAIRDADVVVLGLALTPETTGLVDASFLAAMQPHAWLVNVARGAHVMTSDLVDALAARRLGGAALDVTEPEPLPAAHPLWSEPNCIITPHVANTPEMGLPLITARVEENVTRWATGAPLVGTVDVELGY
jgi:phosphoglycerate dehydrogenase-like enzyme